MASKVYVPTIVKAFKGQINLTTAVVVNMLLDALVTVPDNPDHEFVSDIAADEMADASYARQVLAYTGVGGQANAVVESAANDRMEFHHDDITYTALDNAGVSVKMSVNYIRVGADDTTPADDMLLSCHDIADTTPDTTDFRLLVGATGSLHITA